MKNKEELMNEIKSLISSDETAVNINPDYLEFFTLEELEEIKENLIKSKKTDNSKVLDEIYTRNTGQTL